MKKTLLMMTFLTACKGAVDEEDCWYCTDDTDTDGADTDGTDTDGKDTDGKDTDGKDTDGKDTDGKDTDGKDTDGKGGWTGALTIADGTGSFSFTGVTCVLSYPVTDATGVESCSECSFGWDILLNAPIIEDDTDCGGRETYTGLRLPFGHKDPDILMSGKMDAWAPGGESALKNDMWYFTLGGSGGGGK